MYNGHSKIKLVYLKKREKNQDHKRMTDKFQFIFQIKQHDTAYDGK